MDIGGETEIRTQMLRLSVVDTNPYMTSPYGVVNENRTRMTTLARWRSAIELLRHLVPEAGLEPAWLLTEGF